MSNRSRPFLTFLLCTAVLGISACSTTTHRLGPSQAAINHQGLANGDIVLVRYANEDDARSSSSEQIRITGINESGISGTGENGEAVYAEYDELFQIEYIKVGAIKHDSPELMRVGKAVEVTSKVLLGALYMYVNALGGGY